MARSRTNQEPRAEAADRSQLSPGQAAVTNSEIARRAYERYVARGREDGRDIEDWIQAERELKVSL